MYLDFLIFLTCICCNFSFLLQNVGLPKWSSTQIRNQDVHSNGPVLDDVLLADPEVTTCIYLLISLYINFTGPISPVSIGIQWGWGL